jgi:hypothetical protein
LDLLTSSFSFALTLAMFLFYGFAYVDNLAWGFTANAIVAALFFFGLIVFASDLLSMPFSVYDTFVIEEKYGFNKTTPKTFVLDTIKGWLLGAVNRRRFAGAYYFHLSDNAKYVLDLCVDSDFGLYNFYGHVLFQPHCAAV